MSTIIIRLDLDVYSLEQIRDMAVMQIITVQEIREGSSEFKALDEYKQLCFVRGIKADMRGAA